MKINLNQIKNIILVVAVLVIIGLILFKKDPEPVLIYDNAESIKRIESLNNKIDSLNSSISIIYINAEDEKNIIDNVSGRKSIDSLLSRHFGFKSK